MKTTADNYIQAVLYREDLTGADLFISVMNNLQKEEARFNSLKNKAPKFLNAQARKVRTARAIATRICDDLARIGYFEEVYFSYNSQEVIDLCEKAEMLLEASLENRA